MTIRDQITHMICCVAEALGPTLLDRLVFVGGCTTALFITDPVTLSDVRSTDDVDLIIDLAGRVAWDELQSELRDRGFSSSPTEPVICRMLLGRLKVDFMPTDPAILGFGNRWYRKGIDTAVTCPISDRVSIRRLTPDLFIATKFEAYLGRGASDLLGSRDLEDILLVIDGRSEIVSEVLAADHEVRSYIAEQCAALVTSDDFEHFLQGNIRSAPGRADLVRDRLVRLIASA